MTASVATRSAGTVALTITSGPNLCQFLNATLKGGTGMVEFQGHSSRVRGSLSRAIRVEILLATCEDGSGMLFNFEGIYNGQKVKGFYNAKSDSSAYGTGTITPA